MNGTGQADKVAGLDKGAALELFERELGRLLTAEEAPAFDPLWSSLEGNPLGLIEAAAFSRETGRALAITGLGSAPTIVSRLTARGLTEEEDAGYRLKMAPAAGSAPSSQAVAVAVNERNVSSGRSCRSDRRGEHCRRRRPRDPFRFGRRRLCPCRPCEPDQPSA